MKKKILNSTIAVMFLLIAILVLYFYFKTKLPVIVYIILFGAAAGMITTVLNGYYILPAGMFKYRFWFTGLLYGVLMAIGFLSLDMAEGKGIDSERFMKILLVCIAGGTILIGLSKKRSYIKLCQKTPLQLNSNEREILSDSAIFLNEDIRIEGRAILTSERLCFIPLEPENPKQEWYLTDFKTPPELTLRFGMPNGIYVHDNETKIYVRYAGLWKKKIGEY